MDRVKKASLILIIFIIATIFCCGALSYGSFYTIANAQNNLPLKDKIGGYTTYYADSLPSRAHNIALAAQKLNNTLVLPGQTLSFNSVVGARTAERGFQSANIILDGEFKAGIGGGVCQVSTTLYNAWITSGLEVVFAKAHSMPVSYIAMSRDATVSSSIDLLLKNNTDSPVLVVTNCQDKSINVQLYGKNNGLQYNVVTKLIKELAPAPPEIIYDATLGLDYEEQIKNPRAGYITYAILQTLKDGKIISQKKLREDTYQPVRAKILRGGQATQPDDNFTIASY